MTATFRNIRRTRNGPTYEADLGYQTRGRHSRRFFRKSYSKDEFFAKYKKPMYNPNEQYDYNNSNYHLLAWIIEHVSGMNYDEFLSSNIFEPLHMSHTTVDDGDKIIDDRSFNYVIDYDLISKHHTATKNTVSVQAQ